MNAPNPPLPRAFYARPALRVARELIGMNLVHNDAGVLRIGRIVETEAYQGPHDLAAHSSRGHTARTAVMFGPPGHAYVYFIYGFWNCLNAVTADENIPHAVLIRAVEPLQAMSQRSWGPGLLCRAMNIDRSLNGVDLCGDRLWIEEPRDPKPRKSKIGRSPRIGVAYAKEWALKPWRFFDSRSPYVSTTTAAARARAISPGSSLS